MNRILAARSGLIALLILFSSAPVAPGQSRDRDNPTPLSSTELRGELDGTDTEYFYSFVAGPGELTLTFDVKATGTNSGATFDLFDKNSRPLLSSVLVQAIDRGSDRSVQTIQLLSSQAILMRIKGIDYGGSGNRGAYLVRLNGPVAQGGSSARPPSTAGGNKNEPASEPLSKEGNRPANKPPSRPDSSADAAKTGKVELINEQKRIALIIGNSSYADNPLFNPVNDARDMARALRELGFEVMAGENLNKKEMEEKIRAFGKRIAGAGVGLFYFSGHGLQVNGYNYLLPVGARIEKEQDVEYEAVEAGRVLGEMDAARNRLNIVILDACRNNPFARSFRSVTRGLAVMSAPSGTLVAYSTSPGSVASDGEGANGLYTQELLNGIRMPGLKLEDVFKRVRIAVKEKSKGKQIPWETSALDGDFYFVKP